MNIRQAVPADIPALRELVTRSAMVLSAPYYTPAQTEAIALSVYGVDSELIDDGTFFLVEGELGPVACGGWGKRRVNFGGDQAKSGPGPLLDPRTEPARIRAFFVDPSVARRGLGRRLLDKSIAEAKVNGFSQAELVASLSGEPLYLSAGFTVMDRFDLALPGGVLVPVARMWRKI